MSDLQDRYRAALSFYPMAWRVQNEDAIMGALLDITEGDGRTTPRPLELVNLAVHGIVYRLQLVPSVVPAGIRDRSSTAALAIGAAIALAAIVQLEASTRGHQAFVGEYSTFGPFASPALLVYAAWILAFFASMAGFTTAARTVALATIPLGFARRALADAKEMWLRPTWSFLGLLILLALIVAAGRLAANRVSVRWLVGWFLPAAIVFTVPQALTSPVRFAFQEPL